MPNKPIVKYKFKWEVDTNNLSNMVILIYIYIYTSTYVLFKLFLGNNLKDYTQVQLNNIINVRGKLHR